MKNLQIASTIAGYAGSHYFRQALNLILAFIRPRLLSPENFGLWNLLKILPEYASYTQLGARSAMRFTIPIATQKKDRLLEQRIQACGYWGAFFPSLIFALGLLAYALGSGQSPVERIGLACMGIVVLIDWRLNHSISLLKSYKQFNVISLINVIASSSRFIFSIILIYLFGIYGCYTTEILVLVISLFFILGKINKVKNVKFHLETYKNIIIIGFPLVLLDSIEILIRTVDRYVIAWYLGSEQVGYYGLAIMLSGFMLNIPGASREIMESELMYSLGSKGPQKCFELYTIKPMLKTAYLMPFLVGPAVFLLPAAVKLFLPRYAQGIVPAQIISLAAFFLALSFSARGIIVARGKQISAALWTLPVAGINLFLSIHLLFLGYGIAGVAVATTISLFIQFIILYIFVSKISYIDMKTVILGLKIISFPFICMILALIISWHIGILLADSYMILSFIQLVFYLIFMIYIFWTGKNLHGISIPLLSKN